MIANKHQLSELAAQASASLELALVATLITCMERLPSGLQACSHFLLPTRLFYIASPQDRQPHVIILFAPSTILWSQPHPPWRPAVTSSQICLLYIASSFSLWGQPPPVIICTNLTTLSQERTEETKLTAGSPLQGRRAWLHKFVEFVKIVTAAFGIGTFALLRL